MGKMQDVTDLSLPVTPCDGCGKCLVGVIRLSRMTVWEEGPNGQQIPFGQKMLLMDDEEIPLLELRRLEISEPMVNRVST